MSLLNQTIKKNLTTRSKSDKNLLKNKLAQTMTNADGLGELKKSIIALCRYHRSNSP